MVSRSHRSSALIKLSAQYVSLVAKWRLSKEILPQSKRGLPSEWLWLFSSRKNCNLSGTDITCHRNGHMMTIPLHWQLLLRSRIEDGVSEKYVGTTVRSVLRLMPPAYRCRFSQTRGNEGYRQARQIPSKVMRNYTFPFLRKGLRIPTATGIFHHSGVTRAKGSGLFLNLS